MLKPFIKYVLTIVSVTDNYDLVSIELQLQHWSKKIADFVLACYKYNIMCTLFSVI